ncbi:hypothetical protein EK21DRAFT_107920 [Setomelanomma holmii]|uniref:Uncharacterized protein n=1 Tax=Setomelanomma holmii TaxID=210430 RepID=A0A9P4HGJ8_9PLEO|nr:hypothetical protein EK21DRAFT_107920 [Setomelanomma holmii]
MDQLHLHCKWSIASRYATKVFTRRVGKKLITGVNKANPLAGLSTATTLSVIDHMRLSGPRLRELSPSIARAFAKTKLADFIPSELKMLEMNLTIDRLCIQLKDSYVLNLGFLDTKNVNLNRLVINVHLRDPSRAMYPIARNLFEIEATRISRKLVGNHSMMEIVGDHNMVDVAQALN